MLEEINIHCLFPIWGSGSAPNEFLGAKETPVQDLGLDCYCRYFDLLRCGLC
ncbi:hypothetical protein V2J09_006831 [Rumex salicifolius]